MKALVGKLVSGGQTGADRAALDVAIRRGLPHGGWCPRGRRAEDGPIDARYELTETPGESYIQRTEWNVRDADATVVFTLGPEVTGGSLETIGFARRCGKPFLHIARDRDCHPAALLTAFVRGHRVRTLNVAGSRESKEPGLHGWVAAVLEAALFPEGGEQCRRSMACTDER